MVENGPALVELEGAELVLEPEEDGGRRGDAVDGGLEASRAGGLKGREGGRHKGGGEAVGRGEGRRWQQRGESAGEAGVGEQQQSRRRG